MFNTEETYRPTNIEFNVAKDETCVPESLGDFNDAEEAAKFIGANITSINTSLTVCRHMDSYEKTKIREKYNEILESHLPRYEDELSKVALELDRAKRAEKEAKERVNAALTEVTGLSYQVKRGLVEMNLDELFTSRVPYRGRYYYFTFIDSELRLCKICDIPEREKSDLYNAMAGNEEFFDTNFGKGGETES